MKKIFFTISVLFLIVNIKAQLVINSGYTVPQLVQNVLIGNGVSVSNISFSGSPAAFAKFNHGISTNLGLNSGVLMSTGDAADAVGPNSSGSTSTNNGTGSDPQLAALIPGYAVNDAAVIEFDFFPLGDTLQFQYVFGSDEYPEFVNSSFNDVFGFFVSGPNPTGGNYINENIALIPGTSMPVTIDNVNNLVNSTYYVDNTSGLTIEYDGMTTVLTAWIVVIPCQTYHFKLAVGDAGDNSYDSGVFLKENSFSTDAVQIETEHSIPQAGNNAIEGCNDYIITANLTELKATDYIVYIDSMFGSATNGVDFPFIADSLVVPAGQSQGSIVISPISDGITEGMEYFNIVMQTSICSVDTIVIPFVDYTPITLTTSPDTLICEDSVLLRVNPIDGHLPYDIEWKPPADLSNPNISNPIGYPTTNTSYIVTVKDSTGCPSVKDTVNVLVSEKPKVSFNLSVYEGCEPLSVDFSNFTKPDSATTYIWDFGDGTTSTDTDPNHVYESGVFDINLIATTFTGCVDSFGIEDLITAYPQPKALFDPNPEITTLENPVISFLDLTINPNSWYWDFGDGTTSDQQNPTHTYPGADEYTVMLIASNSYGCKDTIYKNVRVAIDKIIIPNIITPNNDGKNDKFFIKNIEAVESSTLIIYNRWGKKVYEANNYDNTWDADNLADGVYYYVLKYKTYFREDTYTGSITVLRQ